MQKHLVLLVLFLSSFFGYAQNQNWTDSLTYKRAFIHTHVYKGGLKLSKENFAKELVGSEKWSKRNRLANIMIPAGPAVAVGGILLGVDAIKGVPMVWTDPEDGVEYLYVVRSLPKLLIGLAAFVSGLSLVESANEVKANAVKWHNDKLNTSSKTALELRFGVSKGGGIGLTANF